MSKVILIGGFGFIGKNIIEGLYGKHKIVVISRTIDYDFIKQKDIKFYKYCFGIDNHIKNIIENENPDYIINLISTVTAERDVSLFKEMVDSNLTTLLSLYEASKKINTLKLFIQFGTAEEYGNIEPPFKEIDREYPNSPYSLAKQLTTNTAIMLNRNYGFPITVLRPGNVFGKYQSREKFIPYVIYSLLENKEIETTLCEQRRDFIYVKDLVRIIEKSIDKYTEFVGEVVNVSYGENYSLKSIIEFCECELSSSFNAIYGIKPYRENEIMDFRCDNTKLKKIADCEFIFNLFKGLKDYINETRGG